MRVFDLLQKGESDFVEIGSWLESNQIITGDLQNSRKDSLKWFGETEGTFLIAFRGDGCPFGKNETACSFLISFLNTGKRVASSSDNVLIFGANCERNLQWWSKSMFKQHVNK